MSAIDWQKLAHHRRAPWLIAGVILVASLVGVFTIPILDRDEARFAQATAQMLETGDYVEIRFLDDARNKKPVGIHWMQAASVWLTSSETAREIWAYRLPSVLGALLAALAAFFAGCRLIGREAGFAGALLLSASVLLPSEAGIAKTDAMLAATAAFGFFGLAGLRTAASTREARLFALMVWIAMGLGTLVKGPITPMAVGLGILVLFAWERRLDWARPLLWWPAILAGTAIILPWFIAIQLATDGAFLMEALGQDVGPKLVSGHESHDGFIGLHLVLVSALFFPAILTLPAGIRAAIKARAEDSKLGQAVRLIMAFIIPTWLVFEIMPTKLPHYTLPLYPALAVLAGLGLVRLKETAAVWRWLGAGLAVFGTSLGGPGLAIFLTTTGGAPVWLGVSVAVAFSVLALGAALATGLGKPGTALVLAVVSGLAGHAGVRGLVLPAASEYWLSRDAAHAALVLAEQAREGPILSSFTEPSLVFTLGGRVTLTDPAEFATQVVDPATPTTYIIDESRWLRSDSGPVSEADQATRRAWLDRLRAAACATTSLEGVNYSRGDDSVTVSIFVTGCSPSQEGQNS